MKDEYGGGSLKQCSLGMRRRAFIKSVYPQESRARKGKGKYKSNSDTG